MLIRTLGLSLLGILFITGSALAQDVTSEPEEEPTPVPVAGSTSETAAVTGSFEQLSPGNQKIANALYDAQQAGTEGGTAWTLDQIAAGSALNPEEPEWGQVFKEMKAQGLIAEENLGQVVSNYKHHPHSVSTTDGASVESTDTAPAGDATATDTTSGESTTTVPETDSTAGTSTASTTETASNAGSFERLSPGNRKIANALYDAQQSASAGQPLDATQAGAEGGTAWTLDDIAATGQNGTGWGQVFKEMQSQGLIEESNLGQVVSKYQHQSHTTSATDGASVESTSTAPAGGSSAGTEIIITTGSGQQVVVGTKGPGREVGSSARGNGAAKKGGGADKSTADGLGGGPQVTTGLGSHAPVGHGHGAGGVGQGHLKSGGKGK